MIPMKLSSIFKNRWMALLWAGGILWLAVDVAGSAPSHGNASANASETTDITGAPVSSGDEEKVADALKKL